MRRREFIALVGGMATSVTMPPVVRAQQAAMPVVGYIGLETPERYASRLHAFREGLGSTGFEEGRNVTIEFPLGRRPQRSFADIGGRFGRP